MQAKHTATPWHLIEAVSGWSENEIYIAAETRLGTKKIALMVDGSEPENAAFIARACNAHDDLVNALKVLVENGGIGPTSMFDDARDALDKAGAK